MVRKAILKVSGERKPDSYETEYNLIFGHQRNRVFNPVTVYQPSEIHTEAFVDNAGKACNISRYIPGKYFLTEIYIQIIFLDFQSVTDSFKKFLFTLLFSSGSLFCGTVPPEKTE